MAKLRTTHNETGQVWDSDHPDMSREDMEIWVAHAYELSGGRYLKYEIIE